MVRFTHFLDIFKPFQLFIDHICMRNSIGKDRENMFSLFKLFAGTMLFAHILACFWIYLGIYYEDGFMNALKAENFDGVWADYGPYELYVFSLYWIFEVLTTVGYGDFSG